MATRRKRKVVPSLIAGFILALIEMGLPMIGVSVNLWLGVLLLAAAFGLFAYGVWNWETNLNFGKTARLLTVVFVGLVYFGLVGMQIRQYKKDRPAVVAIPPTVVSPPTPPNCNPGQTGDATASGGSIANTAPCVDHLSTGQK